MHKLSIITHPDCEHHDMPNHPERPDRLRAVMTQLQQSGTLDELEVDVAEEITDEGINLVHPQSHIDRIKTGEPDRGVINKLDPDTYMSFGSNRAARLAAGACLTATQQVLAGTSTRVFCAVRPPGHHAEIAAAMGFCLFNNVAIAAEAALQHENVNRVAICDFDVHHCNGTVDIFKDRPEVMVCSSFQADFYPHRYLDFENPHIINSPLDAGTGSSLFRRQIERDWLAKLEQHKPDLLFISAGFDAHKNDPLGGLNLDEADYRWITEQLIYISNQFACGRIVSTMEGGYDLTALSMSAETHVRTLMQN